MPSTPISRLFDAVRAEPDADFVTSLEERLVAELGSPLAGERPAGVSPTDDITPQPDRYSAPALAIVPVPMRSRRRNLSILVAAAAAVIFVLAALAAVGRDHHVITSTPTTLGATSSTTSTPSTTTGPSTTSTSAPPATSAPATVVDTGFTQTISTDLTSSSGSKLHFEGTVEFSLAVEANERSEEANHNVLLLPRVSGTFANIGTGATTIGDTQVQIFMAGDFPCVQAGGVCGPALTIGDPDTAVLATLQPGETFSMATALVRNLVSVPAGDVPYIIDEIVHGDKVVGTSVSVLFDGADLRTALFDRAGTALQTCAALAADCMDANRSVLGADAAPVGTAVSDDLAFPAGAAPAGTYAPAHFLLPYKITTLGPWQVVRDDSTATLLRRHDSAIVAALQISDGSTVGATTPGQALAALCAGDASQDPVPEATTLFGQNAIQIDGVVTADCAIEQTLKYGDLRTDTFRAAATMIDGHVVYVIGVAPTKDWATFGPEFDATVASLTLR